MSTSISTPKVSTQVEFFSTATANFAVIRDDIQFREERVLEAYIQRALQVWECDFYFKKHKKDLAAQGIKAGDFKERCGVHASEKSSWSNDLKIANAHTADKFAEFQGLCAAGAFKFHRKDYMEFLGLTKPKSAKECREGQVYLKFGNDDKGVWVVLAEQPKSVQNALAKLAATQEAA